MNQGKAMTERHEGDVRLIHEFDKAWEFLNRTGKRSLQTAIRTPFVAEANVTQKGEHKGERVIIFRQERNGELEEFGRSYECCWGRYHNWNRTRIGMYCQALDNVMKLM